METPDYLSRTTEHWGHYAAEYVEPGRRNWSSGDPRWGIWQIPESDVKLLPNVRGKDTLELGCGTGYVSAWLARRGGRAVGIDPTPQQLTTATIFQDEFDLKFPLVRAVAEKLPFADESFDVLISEYGASIWSDPYLWVPESARVLRPGGELVFLVNGTLLMLCAPDSEDEAAGEQLLRDYFGMHRFEWTEEYPAANFYLGYGNWIRLLRANGFEIIDLVELRPDEGATTRYPFVTNEWARRWPSEEVWKVKKKG